MTINPRLSVLLVGVIVFLINFDSCSSVSAAKSPAAITLSDKIIADANVLKNTATVIQKLTRTRRQLQGCPRILLPPGQCIATCHCGNGQFCSQPDTTRVGRCRPRNFHGRG
ncbi:Cadherin-related hmr-1 [Orchesella cincta]|uniref:Cadherin-related hmr-1 n=1 Tax=Orchesella cincta TaxID=48709 RepID=A0A1D2M8P0_ORCCI|nr:Cadherin-related hmr-1 [Orchesella cincta]